ERQGGQRGSWRRAASSSTPRSRTRSRPVTRGRSRERKPLRRCRRGMRRPQLPPSSACCPRQATAPRRSLPHHLETPSRLATCKRPQCDARTASVNAGHADVDHVPKRSSPSVTIAIPASTSATTKPPDCPKCPTVDEGHVSPVQWGRLDPL